MNNATDRPWRDAMKVHPADIKQNGLQAPIILLDGLLLDGRNRLQAMQIAEIDIENVSSITLPSTTDPFSYVLSADIHRRHLTAEQKRKLIVKVLKAKPEASNRQIAAIVKRDHKTVAAVRGELEGRGEIPHIEVATDTKGRHQPVKKPRRNVDGSRTDTRAKKLDDASAGAAQSASRDSTEHQYEMLKQLWRMNNVLRVAWERSNQKAKRRFLRWLDGGPAEEEDRNTDVSMPEMPDFLRRQPERVS